jgi:hypothetical protein
VLQFLAQDFPDAQIARKDMAFTGKGWSFFKKK